MSERLDEHRATRDFDRTGEPSGITDRPPGDGAPRFVIQHHKASSEHDDCRIESDGVLLSWAMPQGPSEVATLKGVGDSDPGFVVPMTVVVGTTAGAP